MLPYLGWERNLNLQEGKNIVTVGQEKKV